MILPDGQTASSWLSGAGDLLIPVSRSWLGVGGGVEQNDGNGSGMSRSGL